MVYSLLCGLLILSEQQPQKSIQLQIKVERISWQGKLPIDAKSLAKAKATETLSILTESGEQFRAKATVGKITLRCSGALTLNAKNEAEGFLDISFGDEKNLQKTSTRIVTELGKRVVVGGVAEGPSPLPKKAVFRSIGIVVTVTREPAACVN